MLKLDGMSEESWVFLSSITLLIWTEFLKYEFSLHIKKTSSWPVGVKVLESVCHVEEWEQVLLVSVQGLEGKDHVISGVTHIALQVHRTPVSVLRTWSQLKGKNIFYRWRVTSIFGRIDADYLKDPTVVSHLDLNVWVAWPGFIILIASVTPVLSERGNM